MRRTKAIRTVVALFAVVGLLVAPMAWAGQGPDRDRGDVSVLVAADQWIQSFLAEMAGWFGIEAQTSEDRFNGKKDSGTSDEPTLTPDGGDGGTGGATDGGSYPDPNGG